MSPDPRLKMAEAATRENERLSQFIVSDKAIVAVYAQLRHFNAQPAGCQRISPRSTTIWPNMAKSEEGRMGYGKDCPFGL
jgi:hypothetical protein